MNNASSSIPCIQCVFVSSETVGEEEKILQQRFETSVTVSGIHKAIIRLNPSKFLQIIAVTFHRIQIVVNSRKSTFNDSTRHTSRTGRE